MHKYKIVAICQVYNELNKGNLERFFKYVLPLVSNVVVYDDGSTDGSYEYAKSKTPFVVRKNENEFESEIEHKEILVQKAKVLNADFILWLDADEVLSTDDPFLLQKLCSQIDEKKIDALSFYEVNLWRSTSWQRIDSLYETGWFVRLWKVTEDMHYKISKKGLHQRQYPTTINIIEKTNEVKVIHYGFSSEKQLSYKYITYKSHGQRGFDLDRLINEDDLKLQKVSSKIFPKGLWHDDNKPKKYSFINALSYVEQNREKTKFIPGNILDGTKVNMTIITHPIFEEISKLKNVRIIDENLIYSINPSNTDVLFLDNIIKSIEMPCILKVLYIPKESIYNEKVNSDKKIINRANILITDSLEVISFYRDIDIHLIPQSDNDKKIFWQNLFKLITRDLEKYENNINSFKLEIIVFIYKVRQLYRTIVSRDIPIINLLKEVKHVVYTNFFR